MYAFLYYYVFNTSVSQLSAKAYICTLLESNLLSQAKIFALNRLAIASMGLYYVKVKS